MSYPPPPPGGGYGPPPGAGGYGYGYGYGPVEHPQGTTVLVMGILSLVICALIGPFAWNMGNKALAEIDAQPGRFSNRGQVQAGRICGIVGSCLLALNVVIFGGLFLVFVLGAAFSSSGSG